MLLVIIMEVSLTIQKACSRQKLRRRKSIDALFGETVSHNGRYIALDCKREPETHIWLGYNAWRKIESEIHSHVEKCKGKQNGGSKSLEMRAFFNQYN